MGKKIEAEDPTERIIRNLIEKGMSRRKAEETVGKLEQEADEGLGILETGPKEMLRDRSGEEEEPDEEDTSRADWLPGEFDANTDPSTWGSGSMLLSCYGEYNGNFVDCLACNIARLCYKHRKEAVEDVANTKKRWDAVKEALKPESDIVLDKGLEYYEDIIAYYKRKKLPIEDYLKTSNCTVRRKKGKADGK